MPIKQTKSHEHHKTSERAAESLPETRNRAEHSADFSFTCPRCSYRAERPEIYLDVDDEWIFDDVIFAHCPSCRFYGPAAADADAAAGLFSSGAYICRTRCQDCGLNYPFVFNPL